MQLQEWGEVASLPPSSPSPHPSKAKCRSQEMSFKFPAASMTSEDVNIQLVVMKALVILRPLLRLSSESLVLNVGSQASSSISLEFVRNADPQAVPQTHWLRYSKGGIQSSVFAGDSDASSHMRLSGLQYSEWVITAPVTTGSYWWRWPRC